MMTPSDSKVTMNKIAAIFVLSTVCTTAIAEWSKQIQHPGQTVYVDYSTIRKNGKLRQIWSLQDFDDPKCVGATCYRSTKLLREFDCKGESLRTKHVVFYEGRMGEGRPVHELKEQDLGDDSQFTPVVPATHGFAELQGICGKK